MTDCAVGRAEASRGEAKSLGGAEGKISWGGGFRGLYPGSYVG